MKRFLQSRTASGAVILAVLTVLQISTPPAVAGVPPGTFRDCDMPNQAAQSTIVTRWNVAALEAICMLEEAQPTIVSRKLYLLHTAMYDAWAAYDSDARPVYAESVKRKNGPEVRSQMAEAISFAALEVLFNELPGQQDIFFEQLESEGYSEDWFIDPPAGSAAAWGIAVARAVLSARGDDGANARDDFKDTSNYVAANQADLPVTDIDPNRWQPLLVPDLSQEFLPKDFDPVTFDAAEHPQWVAQSFVTPHWPSVTPFALASSDQLRPGAPPQYGDASPYTDARGRTMSSHDAWLDQTIEVMLMQANLTEEQKVMAQVFSQDGPYYALPAGQWNFFAQQISFRDGHNVDDDVKMFFALNAAQLDAGIAAWDAKRHYDFVRPVTAIRFLYQGTKLFGWRGPGKGIGEIDAAEWHPYQWTSLVSPAHPEYVSGHATFCGAGGETLRRFTGSDRFYDASVLAGDFNDDGVQEPVGSYVLGPADGMFEPDVPSRDVALVWETFTEVVEQCGLSRLYNGAHFSDANLRGQQMGRTAGSLAYERARSLWEGESL